MRNMCKSQCVVVLWLVNVNDPFPLCLIMPLMCASLPKNKKHSFAATKPSPSLWWLQRGIDPHVSNVMNSCWSAARARLMTRHPCQVVAVKAYSLFLQAVAAMHMHVDRGYSNVSSLFKLTHSMG